MKDTTLPLIQSEPMGIIISRGERAEPTPRISAYVWGPAPEPSPPKSGTKAA
jgi:hypothetical protein